MKSYYACLDTGFVKYAPQPLQHLAVADKAGKLGGKISFYTMEDFDTLATQLVMKGKLEENPLVDGVVYFTLKQCCYGGKLDLKFLHRILDMGYEVHFARENISIPTKEALDSIFPMLYSAQHLMERDEARDYWRPVWDWVDETATRS